MKKSQHNGSEDMGLSRNGIYIYTQQFHKENYGMASHWISRAPHYSDKPILEELFRTIQWHAHRRTSRTSVWKSSGLAGYSCIMGHLEIWIWELERLHWGFTSMRIARNQAMSASLSLLQDSTRQCLWDVWSHVESCWVRLFGIWNAFLQDTLRIHWLFVVFHRNCIFRQGMDIWHHFSGVASRCFNIFLRGCASS